MQAILTPTLQPGISAKSVTAEHPFEYLPGSGIRQYAKHETIYFQGEPATRVYLVVEGKVKIVGHESRRVVVDLYRSDERFGESVLAGHAHRMEQAVAIEPTKLMSWTRDEIEKNVASSPEFATALIRFAARRSLGGPGRKAAVLVVQLLAYAEISGNVLTTFDLSALTEELIPLVETSIPKIVQLDLALAPGLPWLTADSSEIQQIVINGAESFGPEGGTLRVSTGLAADGVFLEVQDFGCGMDDATNAGSSSRSSPQNSRAAGSG
jgi:signal transduction histidine kinase